MMQGLRNMIFGNWKTTLAGFSLTLVSFLVQYVVDNGPPTVAHAASFLGPFVIGLVAKDGNNVSSGSH